MPIFDRFIRYEWAERALDTAVKQESPEILQGWLVERGLGNESARRTRNVLSHLWFDADPSGSRLRMDAINMTATLESTEHLALHWGMAITKFPVFREVANVIGRLGRLQGEFSKPEVLGRVLEKYGNQSTVRRAAERVMQTMIDWSSIAVLSKSKYSIAKPHPILSTQVAEWLFRSLLANDPERYWLLPDIVSASEIFPFEMGPHSIVFYGSPHLTIERDASGVEIVGLRTPEVNSIA